MKNLNLNYAIFTSIWIILLLYGAVEHVRSAIVILPIFTISGLIYLAYITFSVTGKSKKPNGSKK